MVLKDSNLGIKGFSDFFARFLDDDFMVEKTRESIEGVCEKYGLVLKDYSDNNMRGFYSKNAPVYLFDETNNEFICLFCYEPKTALAQRWLVKKYGNVFYLKEHEKSDRSIKTVIVNRSYTEYSKSKNHQQIKNDVHHDNYFTKIFDNKDTDVNN